MIPLLSDAVSQYTHEARRYSALCELIESTGSTESFDAEYASYKKSQKPSTSSIPMPARILEHLQTSGEVCSWSGKPFDSEGYSDMLEKYAQSDNDYEKLIGNLKSIMHDRALYDEYYEDFIVQLKKIVELDADISSVYYLIICKPHMTDSFIAETREGNELNEMLKDIPEQREHENNIDCKNLSDELTIRLGKRDELLKSAQIGAVSGRIEINEIFDKGAN